MAEELSSLSVKTFKFGKAETGLMYHCCVKAQLRPSGGADASMRTSAGASTSLRQRAFVP